jgi:cell shape-determining protein MreD
VFLIVLLLTLALEMSLKRVFVFNDFANVAPSFVIVLLVYLALLAPRMQVMWAALLMGVLLDLSDPLQAPGGEIVYLIGPHAIGSVFAAFLIVQMRVVVFRQRLITMIVFVLLAFLAANVIRVLLLGVRGWFGEALVWGGGSVGGELLRVLLVAVYSCVLAVPIGWLLLKSTPMWAFQSPHQRVSAWR